MTPIIFVDIVPAKRRFSNRKQWKFQIRGGNGEPIDPRDTYANVGDIFAVLNLLREAEMRVRVHYHDGSSEMTVLRAQEPEA